MVRLNRTYLLLNLQAKFFKVLSFSQSTANYTKCAKFTPNIPHHLIIHYVSGSCPGRESRGIPMNYANSTQFAHIVRELREIRTNC